MNHFIKSMVFGIVTLFTFLVASQILNNDTKEKYKISDNAMHALTSDSPGPTANNENL
ncbi:hypothetical protein GGR42_001638 [Saonia flava]|uniref:Uncharacterized protein n=1 Tax=Saonia flava TaxID=523696 RepID=A0A846QQ56_9FLAO|nr:hypothetical protein [Saonia flava]NJB71176.1 hypothetical protein [Saonia flava]